MSCIAIYMKSVSGPHQWLNHKIVTYRCIIDTAEDVLTEATTAQNVSSLGGAPSGMKLGWGATGGPALGMLVL